MTHRWTTHLVISLVVAVAVVGLMAANGRLVRTHGNPEIVVTPSPAPSGARITIEGEEFEEDDEISLTLEGIGGDIALGMATTDAEGAFHIEARLPDAAAPGSYRIRAEGSDASAVLEFRISGAGRSPIDAEHERSLGFHREGPASEVIGLAALTAVLAVAGVALLLVRERPSVL